MKKLPLELRKHFYLPPLRDERYQYCSYCDGYGLIMRKDEIITNCNECSHSGLQWICPECGESIHGHGFVHYNKPCQEKIKIRKQKEMLNRAREEGRLFSLKEHSLEGHYYLYSPQIGYNEGFICIENDLAWVLEDLEPGTYFFTSCSERLPSLDAFNTIESLLENSWEDADVPDKEYKNLQDYYDKFCERNHHLTTYEPDWKTFFEVVIKPV